MQKFLMTLFVLATAALASPAQAAIPLLNVTCGDGVEVHADHGGPVYIDGQEARLDVVNDNYSEARLDGTTISISTNTDGSTDVSYTGRGGANGICNSAAGATPAAATTAAIPFFNAECPGGLSVHADEGGPVYLNGEEAAFTASSPTYFEAKAARITVSVTTMPDGSLDVSYTGPGRANGVCQLQ